MMKKRLISAAAAAVMLLSSAMGNIAVQNVYAESVVTIAQGAETKEMVMVQNFRASGIMTEHRSYAAGIAAVQDSSDFLLDCGGRAGYDYLGKMENGRKLQKLYDEMLSIATGMWNDPSWRTEESDGYICYGQIDGNGLDFDTMSKVYYTFRNDNPIFYFVGGVAASDGINFYMFTDPEYENGSDRLMAQQNIENYITSTAAKAEGLDTDYEKAKAMHDAVNADVDYAYDSNGRPSMEVWAHNIMGAVENGSGVCETYARTYQALLNYLDIDNYFISGKAGGGDHAWNLVRLDDGKYYYVDCTWDDSLGDYTYFAKGSLQNHTPDGQGKDPLEFLIELPKSSDWDFDPDNYIPVPKFALGDVNGDSKVNVLDISVLVAHVKGVKPLKGDQLTRADISGDGKIDVMDIARLAAKLKGIG